MNWTTTRVIAIIVAFISVLLFIVVGIPIVTDYFEVTTYQESRNFSLPVNINLNGTRGFDIDITFVLTFTYHNGTLIVDEPIDLKGRAILLSENTEKIKSIQLGFQNALAYNTTTEKPVINQWEVPQQGGLYFDTDDSGVFANPDPETGKVVSYMDTTTTLIWTIDGNYKPLIAILYQNETKLSPPMLIEDITLTVFPREQLMQIQTNEVNIKLSFAVFIFSIFTIIGVIVELWFAETKHIIEMPQTETQTEVKKIPRSTRPNPE